jgi:DNA topoisomerase-1
MSKNLVIVESPAKADTIKKFLGNDYTVKSSYGHVRDLVKKNFGIDINNNYAPDYQIIPEKKKLIAELKKEVEKADTVLLASDEDREGEAIAWHLYEVLNLKKKNTKRIVFNEITKEAITHAVKNPGNIDLNLVNAQQARRVLERLVVLELSSFLWKKVQSKLSAGRVQSVAVRLIVEKEREILNFKTESFYKIIAEFQVSSDGEKKTLTSELIKEFRTEQEVLGFFNALKSPEFFVSNIEKKPGKRSPAPPFTTSSLQQEASRKLGFPVGKTMKVAQSLYESGYITYMRTDSVNLSSLAITTIKDAVVEEYGENYYKRRNFQTKTKNAQEAHEAIRPAYIKNKAVKGSYDEVRLYDLIRKRTLATQMADAEFEKTNVEITVKNSEHKFLTSGEIITFQGFLKVYASNADENEQVILPPLNLGQGIELSEMKAYVKFTKYPSRYTEAALVKQLEERGIGRPSTYAPTISVIESRGYVVTENRPGESKEVNNYIYNNKGVVSKKKEIVVYGAEKNKLFPTDIAMVVTDFLKENFENVIDYNFTAEVEQEFDDIAAGELVWYKMIDNFYKSFHEKVENTIQKAERNSGERILGTDPETGKQISVRIGKFGPVVQCGSSSENEKPQYAPLGKEMYIETVSLEEALKIIHNAGGNGRLLGIDPESGKNVYSRFARYGAIVQIGENDDKEKPKYAALLKGMTIDKITLVQALSLFRLPREIGEFEGKKVVAGVGKFGPYIRHDSVFVSLKKDDNPLTVSIERAAELINEKREKDNKRLIKDFGLDKDIKIIKDRWGKPCIYHKKTYIKLPAKSNIENLTLEECLKIIENEMPKDKKPRSSKSAPGIKKNSGKTGKSTTARKSNTNTKSTKTGKSTKK